MLVRIKYTKSGTMKFIGHLDVMRYFQKAVKRAGFDIAYSKGFSPHQLMSFAAPLALGVTSEGEYFEAEFNSLVSSKEFIRRFNEQMVDGMRVNDVVLLPEGSKKAMSIVCASDYLITILDKDSDELIQKNECLSIEDREKNDNLPIEDNQKKDNLPKEEMQKKECMSDAFIQKKNKLLKATEKLMKKNTIEVFRKTKKQEKIEDIKPGIIKLSLQNDKIYMLLATGSEYNLKPDSVIEAICNDANITYNKFDYQIHRIETYTKNDSGELISLIETGEHIE
ncbi:MAG: TIGR03936 family radical SAM-associated protein [Lachnospiraceae bacterium]